MKTLIELRNFFAAIPDKRWCIRFFHQDDRSCANGHLMSYYKINNSMLIPYPEGLPLDETGYTQVLASINNGTHPSYTQLTPKQRVLAYIDDLIKKQKRNESRICHVLESESYA